MCLSGGSDKTIDLPALTKKVKVNSEIKSDESKNKTEYFKQLLLQFDEEPDDEFLDPIYFNIMKDPVVISSGQVLDRSTILDKNGQMKMDKCPITRQFLKDDVFPLSYLKGKLTSWKIQKFNKLIDIAQLYSDDQEKFEKVSQMAEVALTNLGEEVYTTEANKLANLLLTSKFLEKPLDFAKCYKRVYNTLDQHEKGKLRQNEIQSMKLNAQKNLDEDNYSAAKDWLNACEFLNKAMVTSKKEFQ